MHNEALFLIYVAHIYLQKGLNVMTEPTKEELFKEIMEQHKNILFKVARAYCSNKDDRQDLIQEMMIQIWKSTDKYDNRLKMSTWIYRISLNVAISFYRKNVTRILKFSTLDIQPQENEEKIECEQQLALLEQFINELQEIDKSLIILYLDNKSHAEIADIIGISVSNVGTKIGRIKDKLKIRFSNLKIENE